MKPLSIYVLCIVRLVLETFVRPVVRVLFKIYYKYYDKSDYPRPLPKCKSKLLTMPAVELAKRIRNKQNTSYEVVQVYIDRIKEVNPLLNCVVHTLYTEAIEEAKRIDKILSGDLIPDEYSEKRAPLLGVPFSCKECFFVAGCPNTTGVFARREFVPTEDADVVRYMREAGAVLTCLTNTSEACMWLESSNYYYGTTRNPYNLSRIVGGSSGGEGCIVASGGSVMGVGSDIGGSIRMPAFFNGVYGHKPSSMLISNEKQHPSASGYQTAMLGTGPICRYASDLKLLFKVFAGPNYERVAKNFETPVDFKSLKYYYIDDMQGNMLFTQYSPDALNALNSAKNYIEQHFKTQVRQLKLPKLKKATQIWMSMMANGQKRSNKFSVILNDGKEPINPYCELIKTLTFRQKRHTLPALGLAIAERIPNPNPGHYIELGKKLSTEVREILGQDGVLLFPSFPVCAPYHNQALITNPFDYITYGIINALGLPATQCPMGLSSSESLPTGVQLVANHNCDHLTISLAEHLEANLVGWTPAFDTL